VVNKLALATILLVCIPRLAHTQTQQNAPEVKEFQYKGSGYAAFGFGVCEHGIANISGTAGGDVLLGATNIAVGGEVGAYRFVERSSPTFGIAALNLGYHFVDRTDLSRMDPFLSFGPGVLFGNIGRNWGRGYGVSVGGGFNYWPKRKTGIRTEARLYSIASDNIMVFRFGFSFR
jgi:hypothetical protein